MYAKARDHLRAADATTLSRWAVLMKIVVEDLIEVAGIDEQDRLPITEEESAELHHVRDADTLMRLLRERDALNSVVMDRYLDAIKHPNLGSAVWLAVTVDETSLWAMAIVFAIITGADELYAQAVVREAVLHHPEVLGVVEEFFTSMSAPIEDVMPWLIQEASAASAYEAPARHFLQPTDFDEGEAL